MRQTQTLKKILKIKIWEKTLKKADTEKVEKLKEKVDEDGTVYEWDEFQKAWFPKVTQDFLANYQQKGSSIQ